MGTKGFPLPRPPPRPRPEPSPDIREIRRMKMEDKLTASEAIYGFMAWLSTRKEVVKIGSSEECSPLPVLVGTFCDENKLKKPRKGWENNLIHPKGECSGPTA